MNSQGFAAVTLARILRPWGRRGEVAAEILTDFPQRLTQMREVWLADGRTPPQPASVLSCRIHLGQAIFHFAGIETISQAERLRGLEVQLPVSERAPIGPGQYYITDLIGCEVWEPDANGPLGTVHDVQSAGDITRKSAPEAWVLAVATTQGEMLIPLAAEICTKFDIAGRRIEVRLPEGLRQLNAG
jgi:16S rRNA processing protein RimM